MAYYSRSAWTSTSKSAVVLAGTGRTQTEIYIHYPGQRAAIGRASVSSQFARLRGYRRQHVNGNGWTDIAYGVAVDQRGNVYELRGIDRQSGANGGTASNRRGQAILVLVGNNETPTPECIAGIQDAIRRIRRVHPSAKRIRGHRDSPDASTACPGSKLTALVRNGSLEPGATSAPRPGASKPAPAVSASGKLKVDGRWGRETTKALQRFLKSRGYNPGKIDGRTGPATWGALQGYLNEAGAGIRVDGLIENQSYRHNELGNGISPNGWRYTGRKSKGSKTIRNLQKWIGVGQDGVAYEGTTEALQRKLNVHAVGMG